MNPYYEFDLPFLPATLARAEEVNTQFMAIQTGFDAVKIDVDFADTKAQEAAASAAESAASAAEALVSETNARNFAEQIGSDVDDFDDEYSAREWATGDFVPSGSSRQWAFGTRPEGSSREWAVKLVATVDGADYSAKEWAIGNNVPQGSAKFWAETAVGATNYVGPYDNGTPYTQGQIVDQDEQLYLLRVPTSLGVAPPDPVWLQIGRVLIPFAYDDRAELRDIDGPDSLIIAVDGLGVFTWQPVELLDDDETAFATENGSWSMIGTHPDTVFAHQIVEEEEQNRRLDELEEVVFVEPNFLTGTLTSGITSVAYRSSVALELSLLGAEVGDTVLATSRGPLGATDFAKAFLNLKAYVQEPDVVTLVIANTDNDALLGSGTIATPLTIDVRVFKQTGA
ncbi:MAG TPA: hypothetical protein DDZ92_03825 [Halomonas sp.]|nr:hypothetical protein [Halomonas sp.]